MDVKDKLVTLEELGEAIQQSTAIVQKQNVSLSNINANITIDNDYRVATYSGKTVVLFMIITVNTQVSSWTRLCTIADNDLIPSRNNQRWVLTNGTSSAIVYFVSGGHIYTQTILPVGTYYATMVYFRSIP